ncbi:DUF4440 domain-containing protein [Inconstantimicrobium mannanitabidum]|uniref:Uncharacterized protein n=1 Tax=Inconstantimicrobium mannanitabidum TaxID=1604901 RepID=A0ACB5RFT7_9CLOT|nr:DUF4440 domain-containing protein [Clostridium sp. TW13]GKX67961.1 hypothetical protein rsdtw13_32190 [Clostridium sp. TW13]
MESIKEHILQLEYNLLKSEVRKSSEKINKLLSDDYIEFCSSGIEYHYKNGDIFQSQDDNTELKWDIVDFEIKQLSDDCILAIYKVKKNNGVNESKKYSLRSSIWKCFNGHWKMIFHQGTLTTKSIFKK